MGKAIIHLGRTHLTPFLEGPHAWLTLARNFIPLAGGCWMGWSNAEVVLQIWFGGITELGAMMTFMERFSPARSTKKSWYRVDSLRSAVAILLFCMPYWILLPTCFMELIGGPSKYLELFRALALPLTITLAMNIAEQACRGYDRMTQKEIHLEFQWAFYMHLLRISVITFGCLFLWSRLQTPMLLIPMMLGLSYVEIYPMRALRLAGNKPNLDPINERRSPD